MQTYQQEPRLIERRCGGWIARSSREDRLQIGVIAQDRETARTRYASALTDWERIFASAKGCGMTDDKPQIDKFKEAARELKCDDDEQRFKERLGKLVKPAKPDKPGD